MDDFVRRGPHAAFLGIYEEREKVEEAREAYGKSHWDTHAVFEQVARPVSVLVDKGRYEYPPLERDDQIRIDDQIKISLSHRGHTALKEGRFQSEHRCIDDFTYKLLKRPADLVVAGTLASYSYPLARGRPEEVTVYTYRSRLTLAAKDAREYGRERLKETTQRYLACSDLHGLRQVALQPRRWDIPPDEVVQALDLVQVSPEQ